MSQFRFARAGLLVAALGLVAVPELTGFGSTAFAQSLRGEVGKPLQEAASQLKSKRYKEAMAKVREADNASGKTPAEQLAIERTRASVAQASGDYDTAAKAFEAALATGKLSAGETKSIHAALSSMYFATKNWPKAIDSLQRQLKDGDDPQVRAYLLNAYYSSGDFKKVREESQASVNAAERAGRAPSQDSLNMLANAALKLNDKGLYVSTIEKLVQYYSSKDGWADLLARIQTKPGFSDRLALDVYRLKLANGQLKTTNDYMEMAQLSLQAGAPHEALKIIDTAYKNGLFGSGTEAPRQKRLKDLADKTAAETLANAETNEAEATKNKDSNGLANLGFELVAAGKADKGLPLLAEAIKDKSFKRVDDAKLHYGIALMNAGKKQEAVKMFKSVGGTDGTADLARYWNMYLKG